MYQPPEEMLIRGTAALLAYMQRLLQAKSLHTREQVAKFLLLISLLAVLRAFFCHAGGRNIKSVSVSWLACS